jgi:acetate kinase
LNGVAIGNSMGMSPQSGLPHNNRVGDLDAEAIPYATKALGITMEEARREFTKESGLKGLSGGLSNDIRDIREAAGKGNAKARLAIDVLVTSARHWMGSYFFAMNGADALVFTAGIGENQAEIREAICANLERAGIAVDREKNQAARGREAIISPPDSPVKVMVIPTNEELVVAREAKRWLEQRRTESLPTAGHETGNRQEATRTKLSNINQ